MRDEILELGLQGKSRIFARWKSNVLGSESEDLSLNLRDFGLFVANSGNAVRTKISS